MKSAVETLSPTRVKLNVEVPFEELKPSIDEAYKTIATQVQVPGFRKGKVPNRIIDQRFGRGAVVQEAVNDALPELYGQALAEHDITPLGQPEVNLTSLPLEDGQDLAFEAEVDVVVVAGDLRHRQHGCHAGVAALGPLEPLVAASLADPGRQRRPQLGPTGPVVLGRHVVGVGLGQLAG